MRPHLVLATLITIASLPACQTAIEQDEPSPTAIGELDEPDPAPIGEDGQEPAGAPAIEVQPSFVLTLDGGEQLKFFADEDGSVGVLGETPLGSLKGAAMDHPQLTDASPAMLYYAVTKDGEVPPELLSHHEDLAGEGQWEPFESAVANWDRGWFLAIAGNNSWSSSPCLNATFDTNHCSHPSYDDDVCYFNSSSSLTWYVSSASRYKAGYCLQQGSNRSWLYYREGAGDCLYWAALNFVWGIDSYLFGDEYNATTYRTWTWWKGSGSPVRFWKHFGGGGSGDVFDWGQRYSQTSCN